MRPATIVLLVVVGIAWLVASMLQRCRHDDVGSALSSIQGLCSLILAGQLAQRKGGL